MAGEGLDEGTAERLLGAQLDPDDAPPGYAEVARLFGVAAGPAEACELVDGRGTLGAAVAVVARRDAGAPRRWVERPGKASQARQQAGRLGQARLGQLRPVRTAAVAAIAVAAASTAAAAGTGTLPVIFHTPTVTRPATPGAPATPATSTGPAAPAGTSGGGPTTGRGSTTGGASTTGRWPGAPSTTRTVGAGTVKTLPFTSDVPGQGPADGMSSGHANFGLCTAFLASEASASGAAPATPAFGALVAAHGGNVATATAYCESDVGANHPGRATAPGAGPTGQGHGSTGHQSTGAQPGHSATARAGSDASPHAAAPGGVAGAPRTAPGHWATAADPSGTAHGPPDQGPQGHAATLPATPPRASSGRANPATGAGQAPTTAAPSSASAYGGPSR